MPKLKAHQTRLAFIILVTNLQTPSVNPPWGVAPAL